MSYNDNRNYNYADFFLSESNGEVVERIFTPVGDFDKFKQKKFITSNFSGVKFDKIVIKCQHFSEIMLVNKTLGVVLFSREGDDSPVTAISFAKPEMFDARISANLKRECTTKK